MRYWFRSLFERNQRDAELNDELSAHLEFEIEARMKRGESRAEAERNARLRLGNPTNVAEQTRASWSLAWLEGISQDVRFAMRLMRKSPVFTLSAVASLALGIGANTAIYSVFTRVVVDSLAVQAPDDLFQVTVRQPQQKANEYNASFSYPFIQEVAQQSTTIDGVSCSTRRDASFRNGDGTRMLSGELVCGNLFDLLGLKPALGRLLHAEDNVKPGAHPVIVLAHHFWGSEFGGDPNVLGKTIQLNRQTFTVIGVAPASYFSMHKGNVPAYYIPVVMDGALDGVESGTTEGQSWWLRMFVRRKPGVTVEKMNSEINALRLRNWEKYEAATASEFSTRRSTESRTDLLACGGGFDSAQRANEYGRPFQLLMAVVGVVLLIACINIANLLLARAAARQREIATRLAIGASRWRLIRQFLTESLMLSCAGGVAGFLLSVSLERLLMLEAFGKNSLLLLERGPSASALWLTAGLTLLTGIGFGLAPALTADRMGIRGQHRFLGRKLMVSFQVALSVLLLTGAGLFLQTLGNLRKIDSGFVRENLVSMLTTPDSGGRSKDALFGYYRNLTQHVQQLPGVMGVSLSNMGMLAGGQWSSGLQVDGVVLPEGEPGALRNAVGAGFFSIIGAKFVEGRDFVPADNRPTAPKVAIVNESFARRYFGKTSALGRRIGRGARHGMNDRPDVAIVGVVKDLRDYAINASGDRYWYVPYEQQERLGGLYVNVRMSGDAQAGLAMVKSAIHSFDANLPISRETTMAMAVESQIRQERLVAMLSTFFAGVALLLAVIGLYGVMSYTVERRTREIGIRLALGEPRAQVLGRVMGEALVFIGLGVAAGVPMSLGLGSYAQKLLYGVKPTDWFSIAIAVLAISAFGMTAGWITARRASSIEPMSALRVE